MTSMPDDEIQKITRLIHPGGIDYRNDEIDAARSWGFGENGFHLKAKDAQEYARLVRKIYQKTCESDYSFSQFEKLLLKAFHDELKNAKQPDAKRIHEFRKLLKNEPHHDYIVTRDIYGIKFKTQRELPLSLGPYKIYHVESHKEALLLNDNSNRSFIWDKNPPEYLVGVNIRAKHKERAIEKADELFDKFEKICRFMIGPSDSHDIKVIHPYGRHSRNAYIFSDGRLASESLSWHGPREIIPIDDPYFINVELGHDRLWGYLEEKDQKPLQAKIVMAALWLGQAYEEKSKPAAFIKAAISLEVLFTVNEKSLINPSILSHISETIACLLGANTNDRLILEKSLKEFYSVRSAVAHAGKLNVKDEDLIEFTSLARRALEKILRTTVLSEMETPEKLSLHIKKLKYSFPEI